MSSCENDASRQHSGQTSDGKVSSGSEYCTYAGYRQCFDVDNNFYARQHICYSAYMLSPVRLSLTRVDHIKTVEVRIMKFSPYGSPSRLVFREQVSSRNSEGFPRVGALNEGGVGKIGDCRHISKTVQDRTKVAINH